MGGGGGLSVDEALFPPPTISLGGSGALFPVGLGGLFPVGLGGLFPVGLGGPFSVGLGGLFPDGLGGLFPVGLGGWGRFSPLHQSVLVDQ